MRVLATLALPIALSGCAIPAGLSIASYAADGLSLGASDKSVNDHMISQILGMDCGLFRVFKGRSICQDRGVDPDDNTLYLADGDTIDGPARPWGSTAEPDLAYASGDDSVARDWAVGIELADAGIADDPSARALFGTPEAQGDRPKYVGEYAYNRDRNRKIQAVRGRLEAYYSAAESAPNATLEETEELAAVPSPAPMIVNVDGLSFGDSMGMKQSYIAVASLPPVRPAAETGGGDTDDKERLAHGEAPDFDDLIVPAAWQPVGEDDLAGTEFATDDLSLDPLEVAAAPSASPKVADIAVGRSEARFLVVGSFVSRERAGLAAQAAGSADFTIIETLVDGRTFYRVVTGPFEVAAVEDAKRDLAAIGFDRSWAIRTCPAEMHNNACLPGTAVAGLMSGHENSRVQLAEASAE